jgi:CheY-like chemotaxis protein
MVTAHDREMLAERSESEQALLDGFLVKPVTASMLLDTVVDASIRVKGQPWHAPEQAAAEPRLVGMKVLLTEDNLNNQQVARELLEAEGAIVEVANNGQEAVTRLAKTPAVNAEAINAVAFDVVLMDIQMPVMDGFTATQAIRKELGLVDLPIIAMTANVMASDKAACLNAGMNDHVGKPFDVNNLVDVLRLHAGWKSLKAHTHEQQPSNHNHYDDAAIAANVDVASALARLGGKQELYVRMFPMFLSSVSELPEKLTECLETQHYVQASQHLHSLKGLAGTMGAMHMAAQAGLAEKQLAGDISTAAARLQISNINALIGESLPHFKALLIALQPQQVNTVAAVKIDLPTLIHTLETLIQQLNNFDMASTNTYAHIQQTYGAALGEHLAPLAPLTTAMSNLEFEQAAGCVRAIIDAMCAPKVNDHA